jgi:DNA-binding transcriptional ArsR family regulator
MLDFHKRFDISRNMEIEPISRAAALDALSALAQGHRLDVFRQLVRAGSAGMNAGAIAQKLDLPASSLSFHLSHLAKGELITARREGRSIIYSANFDQMRSLLGYLLENCCAQGDCTELSVVSPAAASPAAASPALPSATHTEKGTIE